MKIYNRNNSTCSTTSASIPFLKNVNIIPDTIPNCNTIISEQCSSLGRYRTVGVSVIDPKLSYVCDAINVKICGNINICGDLTITGTTILDDTIINGDVTFNHLTICDLSVCNIDISQNLTVGGDTIVEGHTTLEKVTANIVRYQNNSHFFNWGVHIIPVSAEPFTLSLISEIAHGEIIEHQECEITWGHLFALVDGFIRDMADMVENCEVYHGATDQFILRTERLIRILVGIHGPLLFPYPLMENIISTRFISTVCSI